MDLMWYTPSLLELKKPNKSTGGSWCKTKQLSWWVPNQAKNSAQEFDSRKQWLIWTWPIWDTKFLQSSRRGIAQKLALDEFERSCTTALASSWTSMAVKWRSIQRVKPSLSPQSSAIKLSAQPTLLEKPPSHSPRSFLIRPLHPARPGFPIATPSIFRHAHPTWGLSHLTCTTLFLPNFLLFRPQCWNSKEWKSASLWTFGWVCRFLKIVAFQCFHSS